MNRKLSIKTDKRGEYTQFLAPGEYMVTASKDNLSQTFPVKVSIDEREQNFTLKPGGGGGAGAPSDADVKKREAENAAIKGAFEQGVALSNESKYDEAIAKFNEVLVKVPKCIECQTNIAAVYMRKKEYDQAEAAYKKALEINPSSSEAYMGLANAYNAQKKFDQAAEAGAQAQKLLSAAVAQPGEASAPRRPSTRASSPGTPARSPRRRSSSNRPWRPTRRWPTHTTGWEWPT